MAFEKLHLIAKIEFDVESTSDGTVSIDTDVPGNAMAERGTVPVPTGTRHVVQKRLPYYFRGHLFDFVYAPGPGYARIYGARVWARELPTGVWQWYALPVLPTPAGEWQTVKIDVPPTSESWGEIRLPIKATPPVPDWISLEVDE